GRRPVAFVRPRLERAHPVSQRLRALRRARGARMGAAGSHARGRRALRLPPRPRPTPAALAGDGRARDGDERRVDTPREPDGASRRPPAAVRASTSEVPYAGHVARSLEKLLAVLEAFHG